MKHVRELRRWLLSGWRRPVVWYTCFVTAGAGLFCLVETGYTYWDGIWWACVTCLSIGYGDIFPVTVAGRACGLVLGHVALFVILPMIIAEVLDQMKKNLHLFTDAEQKWFIAALVAIAAHLGVKLPPPPRDDS